MKKLIIIVQAVVFGHSGHSYQYSKPANGTELKGKHAANHYKLLPEGTEFDWMVHDDHLDFVVKTNMHGYVSFGFGSTYLMAQAELVVLTKVDDAFQLFEYVGPQYGNGPPDPIKGPANWEIESHAEANGTNTFYCHRLVNPPNCPTCKSVDDEVFVMWAVGPQYPVTPNGLQLHGYQDRGNLGSFKLREGRKESSASAVPVAALLTFILLIFLH